MIGIIGAGISGLTLAYELQKQNVPYILLEENDRVGGAIRSGRQSNGVLLEFGPNSLMCDQTIKEFIDELNLQDELVVANDVSSNRFIVKNKQLTKIPQHPFKLLFSSFFSFSTKIKIIKELRGKFENANNIEDETLHDFFERHFGKEVVEYLVNPFIAGIYAGAPKELITSVAFSKLLEYEKEYKSILKGFAKNKSLERKKIVSFKEGLQTLPNQIAKKLTNIKLNAPVTQIKKLKNKSYLLEYSNNTQIEVEKIIFACPPPITAKLLKPTHSTLSELLNHVKMPPMRIVHSIFDKKDVQQNIEGFGALHPKIENMFTAGSLWNSSIFNGRISNDKVLFTSFVGGSQYTEHAQLPEKEVCQKTTKELQKIYSIKSEPIQQYTTFYQRSIPQYNQTTKLILQERITLEQQSIYLVGNLMDGISIPDCIENAKNLANKLIE